MDLFSKYVLIRRHSRFRLSRAIDLPHTRNTFPNPYRPSFQTITDLHHLTLHMDTELYFDIISLDIELWGEGVSYEVGKTDLPNVYIYVCKRPGKLRPISKTVVTTDNRNSGNLRNALEMALILFQFQRAPGKQLTGYLPELSSALARLLPSEEDLAVLLRSHQLLKSKYLRWSNWDPDSDEDSESDQSDEDADCKPEPKSEITAQFKSFMRRLVPQSVTQPQFVAYKLGHRHSTRKREDRRRWS